MPGFSAKFPRRAPLKYLPVGLAYVLADKVKGGSRSNYPPQPLTVSLSGFPLAERPLTFQPRTKNYLAAAMDSEAVLGNSAMPELDESIPDVAAVVLDIVKANTQTRGGRFTLAEFEDWYGNAAYQDQKNPPPLAVLGYLLGEFLIEETNQGGFRVADQLVSIKAASEIIDRQLEGAKTIHQLFKIGEDAFNQIWDNSTHLIFDPVSGELQLAGRTRGKVKDSPYAQWRLPQHLYEEAIRRYIEDGTKVFEVDLKTELDKLERGEATFIDPGSVANDLKIFFLDPANPGKIIVGVYAYADHATRELLADDPQELRRRSIRGAFSASNRIMNDEAGQRKMARFPHLRYKPPLPPGASRGDIVDHLHTTILKRIAKKVVEISGTERLADVWQLEEAREQRAASTKTPVPEFDLFVFLRKRTVPRPFRLYQVASLVSPTKLDKREQQQVIREANWMGREQRDMEEHLIEVDETNFAFRDNKLVAFASIDSLPYVFKSQNGREQAGRIFSLLGTAVRQEHQNQHLQVMLNFKLLVKRWFRQIFSRRAFRPLKIATRTNDPIVIKSLYKYFSNVKFDNLTLEETAARASFAAHLNCLEQMDESGLVREAYEEPLPPNISGLRMSRRLENKIVHATDGLGPRDARIFVFEYNLRDIIMTALWLSWKKSFRSRWR